MENFDRYSYGILLGLILPAIFGYIYVDQMHLMHMFQSYEMFKFVAQGMLSRILTLSVFPDMALLFLFYAMDLWKLAKGVLIGIFPYLIAAAIVSI